MHAEVDEEARRYRELQLRADRLCSLIVSSDYPAIDIAIEIRRLREFAEGHFPDRLELFAYVYESRFRRLWEQFRAQGGEEFPEGCWKR